MVYTLTPRGLYRRCSPEQEFWACEATKPQKATIKLRKLTNKDNDILINEHKLEAEHLPELAIGTTSYRVTWITITPAFRSLPTARHNSVTSASRSFYEPEAQYPSQKNKLCTFQLVTSSPVTSMPMICVYLKDSRNSTNLNTNRIFNENLKIKMSVVLYLGLSARNRTFVWTEGLWNSQLNKEVIDLEGILENVLNI
jgi:hypothetical protein